MTSEGFGEMFEGDSADTCAGKFSLVSMGGRVEGLAWADPGVRTPISASGNFMYFLQSLFKGILFFYTNVVRDDCLSFLRNKFTWVVVSPLFQQIKKPLN